MSQLLIDTFNGAPAGDGLNESLVPRLDVTDQERRQAHAGPDEVPLVTRLRQHVAFALSVPAAEYLCPGETHAVSHSIHLSRLSSYYSKCRECPHRNDLSLHSCHPAEPSSATVGRVTRNSLVDADRVRGVYQNDQDRTRSTHWGAALASMLWDDEPRAEGTTGHGDKKTWDENELLEGDPVFFPAPLALMSSCRSGSSRRGPAVVIGFDERPASPDIVTGVSLGLRRMGCQVIDLGQTTTPCFQFAVRHLDAAAGLFVTGAGCDPAWIGFDVVGRDAQPWSKRHTFDELEARARAGVTRPTRVAGTQRTFQALVPYEAGLWKHFHALRPLRVVCGSATKLLPRIVDRLFAKLPCRAIHVSLPVRRRNLCDEHDGDVRRVATAVVSGGQHLGMIVDDDGHHCAFVTESGKLVTSEELARLVFDVERHEHLPERDALVTLARVLQALSLSDASFGEVVSRLSCSEARCNPDGFV